jgi:hypothetical protein
LELSDPPDPPEPLDLSEPPELPEPPEVPELPELSDPPDPPEELVAGSFFPDSDPGLDSEGFVSEGFFDFLP